MRVSSVLIRRTRRIRRTRAYPTRKVAVPGNPVWHSKVQNEVLVCGQCSTLVLWPLSHLQLAGASSGKQHKLYSYEALPPLRDCSCSSLLKASLALCEKQALAGVAGNASSCLSSPICALPVSPDTVAKKQQGQCKPSCPKVSKASNWSTQRP